MPSPFPGMCPYIERPSAWRDFHSRFLAAAAEALGAQVLPRSFVRIAPRGWRYAEGAPESFLEIRDRDNEELVTVVELLSPSNKYAGPDREQYLAKCRQVLRSPAHLVEIDLLRGGPRMPWQGMPACDYCVVVSRAEGRPRAGIWPVGLRERLPEVPVPLRGGDADARLDLQALLHRVYDAAGYGYYVYRGQPEPPLHGEDDAWARALATGPGAWGREPRGNPRGG